MKRFNLQTMNSKSFLSGNSTQNFFIISSYKRYKILRFSTIFSHRGACHVPMDGSVGVVMFGLSISGLSRSREPVNVRQIIARSSIHQIQDHFLPFRFPITKMTFYEITVVFIGEEVINILLPGNPPSLRLVLECAIVKLRFNIMLHNEVFQILWELDVKKMS